MLYSSNPTAIEWIQSNITYIGAKPKEFEEFAAKCFKPISLYYHYKSMCKQNYIKYLKSGSNVTYKKYLYAMRGLINAKWVANMNKLPLISFVHTINASHGIVPDNILEKLKKIIWLKQNQMEKDIVENEVSLDNYIEDCLKDDNDAPTTKQLSTTLELDNTVKNIILEKNRVEFVCKRCGGDIVYCPENINSFSAIK